MVSERGSWGAKGYRGFPASARGGKEAMELQRPSLCSDEAIASIWVLLSDSSRVLETQ